MEKEKLKVAMYCRVGTAKQLEQSKQENKIHYNLEQKNYNMKGCYKNGK